MLTRKCSLPVADCCFLPAFDRSSGVVKWSLVMCAIRSPGLSVPRSTSAVVIIFTNRAVRLYSFYLVDDTWCDRGQLRPFFWVNCAHFVKSWRLSTVILIYMSYNFLICHILWHFQDGRHWPWKFHMGQKLKNAPISLKIVSNCSSCHKDSKHV